MPAGAGAGGGMVGSRMQARNEMRAAGHVPWDETPGVERGKYWAKDRKLPREVLRLRGVTTAVKGDDEDYVPKRKPLKERQKFTPLQKAIMGREE